jgi:antitoxin CptB
MPSSHSATHPAGAEAKPSSPALDIRRKRALFRAWHRGTREMDLVMGRFADREIGTMSDDDLVTFEHLLDLPEADVFGWVTGQEPAPEEIDPDFLRRLGEYRGTD